MYSLRPRPSQVGQAPYGLLNENRRGSISSIVKPDTGQANLADSSSCSPVSALSTTTRPSAWPSAVSMLSASRCSRPGASTRRSTTSSMSCFCFLLSLGTSSSSYSLPSTLTR